MEFSGGRRGQGRGAGTLWGNALSPGLPHLRSEIEGLILPHPDQKFPGGPYGGPYGSGCGSLTSTVSSPLGSHAVLRWGREGHGLTPQ